MQFKNHSDDALWISFTLLRCWDWAVNCFHFSCRFLAEIGALLPLADDDTSLSLKDINEKVGKEKNGCCWRSFEVYRHLKSLGYIIRRHSVPWTMKVSKGKCVNDTGDFVSLQGSLERNGVVNIELREESSVIDLFNNLQIHEVRLVLDVYLPNSKFKKSSAGDPSFVICSTE